MRISEKQYMQMNGKKREHKYRAVPTVVDGIKFPSKAEAARYQLNCLRVKAGELRYFLRQVPLHLPGGVVYRVDFVEFDSAMCQQPVYVDVKGMLTPQARDKIRMVEALYPIKIKLVKCVNLRKLEFKDWGA